MFNAILLRGDYGTAEYVAELVAFIASAASVNITGQMIDTSGGAGI